MKFQALTLTLALFSGSVFAANQTIVCNEVYDIRTEVLLPRYSVKVTELADITTSVRYGHAYDAVLKVQVDLTEKLGRKSSTRTFEAVATTEDVMYFVTAQKTQGFGLKVYLDELDQTTMTLTTASREKKSVSMSCDVL